MTWEFITTPPYLAIFDTSSQSPPWPDVETRYPFLTGCGRYFCSDSHLLGLDVVTVATRNSVPDEQIYPSTSGFLLEISPIILEIHEPS